MVVIFYDDFLGASIDTNKWTIIERVGDLGNGEVQCDVAANASVSGGVLLGIAKAEAHTCGDSETAPAAKSYTSWHLQQKTAPFLYGRVKVRAKIPGGVGNWPLIWMLGYLWQPNQAATANIPGANWPHGGWCEIDIAEFWQGARSQVNCTVHFETPGGLNEVALPFDATTRYMVYQLDWSAGALVWSVDAEDGFGLRTLRTVTGASVPNVAMYLVLSNAIGGSGGGTPDPATFPQTMSIDWAEISQDGPAPVAHFLG